MTKKQTPNYMFPLIIMFVVCFLIGFVTTMNNSMISFCKAAFDLDETQGQWINTAFYGAYILSIPFALLMDKIGYKKTLLWGLLIVGVGFIINSFGIKASIGSGSVYTIFLLCMCIVAMGVVMLQLVVNPYVMVLGDPAKGAFRMTASQALNSVATTVAPMFITTVIIGNQVPTPEGVPAPFLGLGIFTLVLLALLAFQKLPEIKAEEQASAEGEKIQYKSSVFKYVHVWLCALGIFMYMGIEIGIPSMLSAYVKAHAGSFIDITNLSELELKNAVAAFVTPLLSYYWGGMMVGRLIGTAILSKFQPRVLLSVCLIAGAACVGISFFLSGMAAVWAMLAAGLFHSVMWPLIFNLGLQQLGPHTKAASGVICTGVIGAGPLTMLMGWTVDNPALGVGVAICLMFVYYAYVLWFNWIGSKIGLQKA